MRGSRASGFSLLEVMVALSILSIGLLGIFTFFSTGHQTLQIANENSLATQLAQNKMESLRDGPPKPIIQQEVIERMTRKWSIAKSPTDLHLWVITVEVFLTNKPSQSVLLKSLLFY
jgi:type IV pilus modification protein PilV